MQLSRKLTAPLSVVLLIITAGLAFVNLPRSTVGPPLILDPNFALWAEDSGINRLMVWDLEYAKGTGDQVKLAQTEMGGKGALEISVFQDGADQKWAYVYLRQTIDGGRLAALFNSTVEISVFLESSSDCGQQPASQSTIFGLEINDLRHVLTFNFCQGTAQPVEFPDQRTVFLTTPSGQWISHRIDLFKEYKDAGWIQPPDQLKLPDRISFSLMFGVAGNATGWHRAYVHGFSVLKPQTSLAPQEFYSDADLRLSLNTFTLLAAKQSFRYDINRETSSLRTQLTESGTLADPLKELRQF